MSDLLDVRAMNFACRAHGKRRYGEFPYARHLAHVAQILLRFSFPDDDLIAAAWLHDVVEDTHVDGAVLQASFSPRIAILVLAVTDGTGKNRRERHAASFERMLRCPESIIIKLADRIANVESSIASESDLFQMYRKEYPEFRLKLYAASLGIDGCRTRVAAMWSYLDDLLSKNQ